MVSKVKHTKEVPDFHGLSSVIRFVK